MLRALTLPLAVSLLALPSQSLRAADPATVDYARDIKPLLSNHCYACHGPDDKARKVGLRLDDREKALKRKAFVPGSAAESEIIFRVTSKDPEDVMPPPDSKKPRLTAQQIDLLQRWVDQGAKFDQHWAYVPPVRPEPPAVTNKNWPLNAVDHFIAAGHQSQGFTPSPEADRRTLVRRLSFDLLGLPPTPEEVEAFVNDPSPDAYEKLVDRMLASKHFGERMATYWLDLVRYADTAGYHSDNHRDVAAYRDYVITAFNENKPFDRFTVEQLAGDLLPSPTGEQKIASGYNKLLQTTEEGGAQAKEYTAKYLADRVRNASSVWLASTMGCSECHTHKFDPFTQKDFYRFGAFFADVQEVPVGRQPQTPLPSAEQAEQLRQFDQRLAALRAELNKDRAEVTAGQEAWVKKRKGAAEPPTGEKLPPDVLAALKAEKPTAAQQAALATYYRSIAPELAGIREQIGKVEADKKALQAQIPQTLVTVSMPQPRAVRVLPRGNWLDDTGELVQPGAPAFLPDLGVQNRRANRLDLANWIIARDNPLTSRVFVNRLWKIMYGRGIVTSLEDFGTQGTLPSHPQLLDWLATEFVAKKWDVKYILKMMAMSASYRQSSVATKDLREKDPYNVWLARQNRFRLDAEVVRDNALFVSGLLSPVVGGPSVKPYQPAGYWAYLNFPTREWAADKGRDQYRRGLYTYWCRSFLHPSMAAFDAPTREECTVERPRSSTPLQALVLLNDPSHVEAARVFAARVMREGGKTVPERLDWAYRRTVSRPAREAEVKVLTALYEKHRKQYESDPAAAQKLLGVGDAAAPTGMELADLAAWTSVARVILNLHETITRN